MFGRSEEAKSEAVPQQQEIENTLYEKGAMIAHKWVENIEKKIVESQSVGGATFVGNIWERKTGNNKDQLVIVNANVGDNYSYFVTVVPNAKDPKNATVTVSTLHDKRHALGNMGNANPYDGDADLDEMRRIEDAIVVEGARTLVQQPNASVPYKLHVTRSIGDVAFKAAGTVIAEPSVKTHRFDLCSDPSVFSFVYNCSAGNSLSVSQLQDVIAAHYTANSKFASDLDSLQDAILNKLAVSEIQMDVKIKVDEFVKKYNENSAKAEADLKKELTKSRLNNLALKLFKNNLDNLGFNGDPLVDNNKKKELRTKVMQKFSSEISRLSSDEKAPFIVAKLKEELYQFKIDEIVKNTLDRTPTFFARVTVPDEAVDQAKIYKDNTEQFDTEEDAIAAIKKKTLKRYLENEIQPILLSLCQEHANQENRAGVDLHLGAKMDEALGAQALLKALDTQLSDLKIGHKANKKEAEKNLVRNIANELCKEDNKYFFDKRKIKNSVTQNMTNINVPDATSYLSVGHYSADVIKNVDSKSKSCLEAAIEDVNSLSLSLAEFNDYSLDKDDNKLGSCLLKMWNYAGELDSKNRAVDAENTREFVRLSLSLAKRCKVNGSFVLDHSNNKQVIADFDKLKSTVESLRNHDTRMLKFAVNVVNLFGSILRKSLGMVFHIITLGQLDAYNKVDKSLTLAPATKRSGMASVIANGLFYRPAPPKADESQYFSFSSKPKQKT